MPWLVKRKSERSLFTDELLYQFQNKKLWMLPYVHMLLVYHGAYPPEHSLLCVGEKVRCQNPVVYHCSNTLSVWLCTKCRKSAAAFDCAGQREVLSRAGLAVRPTHSVLMGFEGCELCSMLSALHVH